MPVSLDEVATDLCAVPPAEFIAARAERVAELSSNWSLAARGTALLRPAPAAQVVNLLSRKCSDDLEQILALGVTTRAAEFTLDRASITALA
jgi:hypothetical protein